MTASKNLQLLNINGVLYKSTRNKLQRKDSCQLRNTTSPSSATPLKSSSASSSSGRTLFVRGTRFVLDKQGFKLTRVSDAPNALSSSSAASLRRIDIGGLTYVASAASHNVFVRTRHHLARTHVTQARQRSLQLLSRSLAKSNVPCAIYQRVGKCAAHLRGKCRKVHDSRQVFICARFLRGVCNNPKCLLSHQVSLAKMPVCKFYLEGICVRDDCPYLHKKVSRNTAICADFLRGYCALADKCAQRHEFLCPDYERSGKCVRVACEYCKRKTQVQRVVKLQQQQATVKAAPAPTPVTAADQRYFISEQLKDDKKQATPAANDTAAANDDDATDMAVDDDSDTVELESPTVAASRPKRAALGILPAYIPLS